MHDPKQMSRVIVLDEHTLGAIIGDQLQILRASVIRGSPYPGVGCLYFNEKLLAGRFRPATRQDFADYMVDDAGYEFNDPTPS